MASCAGGDNSETEDVEPTESGLPATDPNVTATTATIAVTTVLTSPDVDTSTPPSETEPDDAPYEVVTEQSSSAERLAPDRVDPSLGVLGATPAYAWRIAAQKGFVDSVVGVDSIVAASLIDDDDSTTILGLEQATGDVLDTFDRGESNRNNSRRS